MRLFTHKSRWERLTDAATAALAGAKLGPVAKVALGVMGGAVAATAASAAISSIRDQDGS
jgi:hypothetical protein